MMSRRLLTPGDAARIRATWLATGVAKFPGDLADVYFHTPLGLEEELRTAGLSQVTLHGIEGPGWPWVTDEVDERLVASALEAARLIADDPAIIGASSHLLGVGVVGTAAAMR